MTFAEYQILARKTAAYPNMGNNLSYTVLGLAGETGEVAEHAKKIIRDHGGVCPPERHTALLKELGDILWYISNTCDELKISLEDVADTNIKKLFSRMERGKIQGDGDNR